MADTPYILIKFNGEVLDIPQTKELPIALTYEIEDEDDFRQKKAGSALNITVPATTNNSSKLNTLFNPSAEDLLPNDGFDKPMDVVIVGAGNELMKGKAFVLAGRKQNGNPLNFDIDIFGDNADWVIPNKELTILDTVNSTTHIFDKPTIEGSWLHDGTVENEDFVYAPFRARNTFGDPNTNDIPGEIFRPINARPALFLYWILYRGFKNAGYKIASNFFDTDYFRRKVLPWTWGNFLYTDSKQLDVLRFKVLCANGGLVVDTIGPPNGSGIDLIGNNSVTNVEFTNDFSLGGYDNSNTYQWLNNNEMTWEYPTTYSIFGPLIVGFHLQIGWDTRISMNSNFTIFAEWSIDSGSGWVLQATTTIFADSAPTFGSHSDTNNTLIAFESPSMNPGDKLKCEVKVSWFCSTFGGVEIQVGNVGSNPTSYFTNAYFKIPIGGIIDFKRYDNLKNFKWLDLLRGTIDTFNLQLNTDSVTKTVTIEPTHNYSLDNNLGNNSNQGFYNGNIFDWNAKEDISKVSTVERFQDYEKEVEIRMQDDANDGILKLMQDRYKLNLTQAKYIFPERFKKGIKAFENRFFSGVMHYNHEPWKQLTGVSPQLICLVPENIANTSNSESENTFAPKIAHYKGMADRNIYGGWNWDGDNTLDLPFMFAVNYKRGGENDPILTYCDQRIEDGAGGFVIGKGLFKRFFWQRFAIMRHGKKYISNFLLNNSDVTNQLHREFLGIGGNRFQLIKINGYKPLINESTECTMWLWYPVTQADEDNTYPSATSVLTGIPIVNTWDIKYNPMVALSSDIPH